MHKYEKKKKRKRFVHVAVNGLNTKNGGSIATLDGNTS